MRKVYFEDIEEGDIDWSEPVHVDKAEMLAYAHENDPWPFHIDEEAAQDYDFGGLIASGGLTISYMYRLMHTLSNEENGVWAFLGGFEWHVKFTAPVRAGDELRMKREITGKRLSGKRPRGYVNFRIEMYNQKDDMVLSNDIVCMIATRPRTDSKEI